MIVAGKTSTPNWLGPEQAELHCARGAGVWEWAGTATGVERTWYSAAGDAPTVEVLAAAALLREHLPRLRVRVVNVVDLLRLQPDSLHPHGMPDNDFDDLFTVDKPVIFAYHGYPWLIHRLTYRRRNHHNIHARGYKEQGTTTTPFDMLVRNDMDRYRLVVDVLDRTPGIGVRTEALRELMGDQRRQHHEWIREHGDDLPEIKDWHWPASAVDGAESPDRLGPLAL